MKPNDNKLSLEERRKRFLKRIDAGDFRRMPAPVAVVPVSAKVAEAVKVNPESVRISARGPDGLSIIERPQRNHVNVTVMVDYVREVDADGKPVWDRPSVVHEYDPLSRL
jgi:hypothetical protein